MKWLLTTLLLIVCIPAVVSAHVVVNEIAWMGTTNSSSDEWIELYNPDATNVDLSGWNLSATDGSPTIDLSGTISAGGYFLLERTDDTTVPNISADQIYTGALSNGGETLHLTNVTGTIVDSVDGKDSWQDIGGDSKSFETAQRTSGGVWITAGPTPKSQNASVSDVQSTPTPKIVSTSSVEEVDTTDTKSISGTDHSVHKSADDGEPSPFLSDASMSTSEQTIVSGAPVTFSIDARDQYDQKMFLAVVSWNFGDGSVGKDLSVVHTFRAPGQYAVVATVSRGGKTITLQKTVSVIRGLLALTSISSDGLSITNGTPTKVDVSQWSVRSGVNVFVFPHNTYILPGQAVFLSSSVLRFIPDNTAELIYPDGKIVGVESIHTATPNKSHIQTTGVVHTTTPKNVSVSQTASVAEAPIIPVTHSDDSESNNAIEWEVALGGLIAVGGVSAFWAGKNKKQKDSVD